MSRQIGPVEKEKTMGKNTMNNADEMNFNNAAYAQDVISVDESRLKRAKLGLLIAAVAELGYVLAIIIGTGIFSDIFFLLGLIGTPVSYIVGGGLGLAIRTTWGISKKIATFGWLVTPFPVDIFTGLFCMVLAIGYGILGFILLPIISALHKYFAVRKEMGY